MGIPLTTVKRHREFLGAEITKDKGLNYKFIIAKHPHGASVTERVILTSTGKTEKAVMKHHLGKWLITPGLDDDEFNDRNVFDWEYYRDRLGKSIKIIITILAALEK